MAMHAASLSPGHWPAGACPPAEASATESAQGTYRIEGAPAIPPGMLVRTGRFEGSSPGELPPSRSKCARLNPVLRRPSPLRPQRRPPQRAARELAPEDVVQRTLGFADPKLQPDVQLPEQGHHQLPSFRAADADLAVVGLPRGASAPRLQRLVHIFQQDVDQQQNHQRACAVTRARAVPPSFCDCLNGTPTRTTAACADFSHRRWRSGSHPQGEAYLGKNARLGRNLQECARAGQAGSQSA